MTGGGRKTGAAGSRGAASGKGSGPGLGKVGKDFVAGFREGASRKKPDPKVADTGPKPAPEPKHKADTKPATETPGQAAARKPSPRPRHSASTEKGTNMVQYNEDGSLQRWGRNLRSASPAIEELAKQASTEADLADSISTGMQKLTIQGESDLPASPALVAEVAAITAELKQAHAEAAERAARLRSLVARAEQLAGQYGRDHEVDEARLSGERGGRQREKRADVSAAEQDT